MLMKNKFSIGFTWSRRIQILFLLVVLGFGGWLRFHKIDQQGIQGIDDVKYVEEALRWSSGATPKYINGHFYRPMSYFLQGMAMRVFGKTDYAIKILHGLMDLFSITLIFCITARLTRSGWPALAAAYVYAALPKVVQLARQELLHAESTFFVLWSVLFYVVYRQNAEKKDREQHKISLLLVLSGFFLGLSAHTHFDMTFFMPGVLLHLFLSDYRAADKKNSLKDISLQVSVFCFSFFMPFILSFLLLGVEKAWSVFSSEIFGFNSIMQKRNAAIPSFQLFIRLLRYTFETFFSTRALVMAVLTLGALIVLLHGRIKNQLVCSANELPFLLIMAYWGVYSLFLHSFEARLGRLLLPLVALLLITVFQHYHSFIEAQIKRRNSSHVRFVVTIIAFVLPAIVILPRQHMQTEIKKSDLRYVYDLLKSKVNVENKLLVSPVVNRALGRVFQCSLYFGDQAIYQNQLPLKGSYSFDSLNKMLKNVPVAYIWLGRQPDMQLLDRSLPIPKRFVPWLRDPTNPYSLEKDLSVLRQYISYKQGVLLDMSDYGELYWLTGKQSGSSVTSSITGKYSDLK